MGPKKPTKDEKPARHRPFSDATSGWCWPEETRPDRKRFEFLLEGTTFVLRVPSPIDHSPDLRALTVLEASELGKLADGGRVESIRIELGEGWREAAVHRLARRAAFLSARLNTTMQVCWRRAPQGASSLVVRGDPVAGFHDARRGEVALVRAHECADFEDLSQAVDRWLELASGALAQATDTGEQPAIPVVVLKSPADRIHPRIHWIARKLREAGVTLETPDPEDARSGGFVSRIQDAALTFRQTLPVKEFGKYRGLEYEHILPRAKRSLAAWEPLQEKLERGELMPKAQIHEGFGNLKSSQAFAVNLFAGLEHAGLLGEAVSRAFGTGSLKDVHAEFEYWDDDFKRYVGESDHQTQVDVLITGVDGSTLRVFLIEVKLTEPYFGRCRGPYLEENKATRLCGGGDEAERCTSCYLRTAKNRRYLDLAHVAFPKVAATLGADGSCPLRLDGYQLARNLVIRSWLAGNLQFPGVPPVPARFRNSGTSTTDVQFTVVSAAETPAVSSAPLVALGRTPGERLGKLGVGWVDARSLLDAVRSDARSRDLDAYLISRYGPVFA